MRNITVSGNLATDPEILTRGDGSNYTKFRIGNHEFSDGKDGDTKWFTVFYPRTDGIVNVLKKGSGVVVIGDYTDSVYNSPTRGAGVDRTISAFKIDFFSSGAKRDDNQQPAPVATPVADVKPKKTTKAPTPPPAESGVDDLPF